MLPKKKNGELATELKELDVDRVDSVDRPATGRAFIISKSVGFRLYPEHVAKAADTFGLYTDAKPVTKAEREEMEFKALQAENAALLKTFENAWLRKYVKRRVVQGENAALDFVVVDDVGKMVAFKTREDAEGFALDILRAEHPALYADPRRTQARVQNDRDETLTHTMPGGTPLEDHTANADPKLAAQVRPTLWQRHKNTGPLIDGVRQPASKRVRKAVIL